MSEQNKTALQKALDLLSKRSYSKTILAEKLRLKDFEESEIKKAIKRLESLGYLDDLKYAQNLVREYSEFRKYGRQRIKLKLREKKIPQDLIETALQDISDENEQENMEEILNKYFNKIEHLPREKIYNRTLSFMIRRGYSYEKAKSLLTQILRGQ